MDSLSTLLKTIFPCLPLGEREIQLPVDSDNDQFLSEKTSVRSPTYDGKNVKLSAEEAASSIVSALMDAEKAGPSLHTIVQSIVHQAGGWSEYLATKILAALEAVLRKLEPLKAPMQEAKNKAWEAYKATEGFAADHPIATEVLCTVIALGVLAVLLPYVVETLGFWFGFGELGPIEGEWALLLVLC